VLWAAASVFAVAVVGAATFTTLRGLRLFRDVKGALARLADAVAEVELRAAEAERHVTDAERAGERLSASLERLARSRARLGVLLAAAGDVRDAVSGVTRLVPRK
jgi:hypothetical protein